MLVCHCHKKTDRDIDRALTDGARSAHYRPGPFAPDEQHCVQFCDWFMTYSAPDA